MFEPCKNLKYIIKCTLPWNAYQWCLFLQSLQDTIIISTWATSIRTLSDQLSFLSSIVWKFIETVILALRLSEFNTIGKRRVYQAVFYRDTIQRSFLLRAWLWYVKRERERERIKVNRKDYLVDRDGNQGRLSDANSPLAQDTSLCCQL